MQALNRTMAIRTKPRATRVDADEERIAGFAKQHLNADDAVVLYAASARGIELRLCTLVMTANEMIAAPDLSIGSSLRGVCGFIGVPVRDANGMAIGALCVRSDAPRIWSVQDRNVMQFLGSDLDATLRMREALAAQTRKAEEQQLVAREYHHRIRNAFSVSSAVIILGGAQAETKEALVETASAQLAALADAHTAIGFESEATDLSTLIDGALRPYRFSDAVVASNGPAVEISEDKVVSLSLILNELATNSTKYGALRQGGAIGVRWAVEEGAVTIRWQERTPSLRATPTERAGSFGGSMVELSVSQLGATLEREWLECGVDVCLTFRV